LLTYLVIYVTRGTTATYGTCSLRHWPQWTARGIVLQDWVILSSYFQA